MGFSDDAGGSGTPLVGMSGKLLPGTLPPCLEPSAGKGLSPAADEGAGLTLVEGAPLLPCRESSTGKGLSLAGEIAGVPLESVVVLEPLFTHDGSFDPVLHFGSAGLALCADREAAPHPSASTSEPARRSAARFPAPRRSFSTKALTAF